MRTHGTTRRGTFGTDDRSLLRVLSLGAPRRPGGGSAPGELEQEVAMVHGRYGEFKVLVDDEIVVDPGAKAVLGILPSGRRIVEAVRARLESA